MRFQVLRFDALGTPVAPIQTPAGLESFPTLTFNARENRYEIDLLTLRDAVELASHESCVVKLVPADGEAIDLPILHLADDRGGEESVALVHLRVRRVLHAIEWMGPGTRTKAENGPLKGDRCPYCHHVKEIGHKDGCMLAMLAGSL